MGFLETLLALLAGLTSGGDPVPDRGPDCGSPIPKSAGGEWRCTFSDDFSGRVLDGTKWVIQRTATSGYTNGKTSCFVSGTDNVAVSGGTLKLTSRQEPQPFVCSDPNGAFTTEYTSGMVSTFGRFSQAYGRFEFRARISQAATQPGLHSALWLWPADPTRYGPWPASGEIDVAEMFSVFPDRAIPYVHYNAAPGAEVTNNGCEIRDLGRFHTYTLEWSPTEMKVFYDGDPCLVAPLAPAAPLTRPQPFDQPFVVVITQALGVGANALNPATTPLPGTTEIDRVRIWE